MLESRIAHAVRRPTRASPALDAIAQALVMVAKLPHSEQALELRDRCLAYEHIARGWSHDLPTAEEREDLMKRVLALHVAVTRAYRIQFSATGGVAHPTR